MLRTKSFLSRVSLLAVTSLLTFRAHAQTTGYAVDLVVVTSVWINQTLGESGFIAPSDGSVSQTTTLEGYKYSVLETSMLDRGTEFLETLTVSGVASNPGAWLQSVTCGSFTFLASSAYSQGYNSSAKTLTYTWRHSSSPLTNRVFNPTAPVECRITHTAISAWLRPKYQVVGLTYAPPGAKSSAQYSSGFQTGQATSYSSTFVTSESYKTTYSFGLTYGIASGKETDESSSGWTQENDTSSSLSVTDTNSVGITVPGPQSSALGVDHDYDTVYIWLNPEVFVALGKALAYVGPYGWDVRDSGIGAMDVIGLTVGQLRGTQSITDPETLTRLARTWDSALGGLTSADFLKIAAYDPFFSNPSFNPNADTSHRYELPQTGSPPLPTNLVFNYVPAAPGAQPTSQTYSTSYNSTSMAGQGTKLTNTTGLSVDDSASATFKQDMATVGIGFEASGSDTWTWTNTWSMSTSTGSNQSMSLTIVPPLASDNYTGPTAIQVWKDNLFGTFMFYPVN